MSSSLREAKFSDHWRKVFSKKYPFSIETIKITEGNIFNDLNLMLTGNLNVILGKNGVGKTNYLRSIFNFLSTGDGNRSKFKNLLDNNQLEIIYQDNNSKITISESQENDIKTFIFDPCSLIPELQKIFSSQTNLDELLEGYEAVFYDQEQLKILAYVSNISYSKVQVFNLEDEYENFPILPIFLVERDGLSYDSRNMGLGELSMLYFFWLINYISNIDSKSVLLIEEPESFISPLIQKKFINLLVKYIFEKNIFCLISTHSEHIINKIPHSNLRQMLYIPQIGKYSFLELNSLDSLNNLGLSDSKKGILFFEDKAAEIFLKQLLHFSKEYSPESFYFHCSNDESNVIKHINLLKMNFRDFKCIAVFDGDGRSRVESQLESHAKYLFLPSLVAPEQHIHSYITRCDFAKLAKFFGIKEESFAAALQVAEGEDHHEFFKSVSRYLNIEFERFFSELCKFWIVDKQSSAEVKAFINDFRKCLS